MYFEVSLLTMPTAIGLASCACSCYCRSGMYTSTHFLVTSTFVLFLRYSLAPYSSSGCSLSPPLFPFDSFSAFLLYDDFSSFSRSFVFDFYLPPSSSLSLQSSFYSKTLALSILTSYGLMSRTMSDNFVYFLFSLPCSWSKRSIRRSA